MASNIDLEKDWRYEKLIYVTDTALLATLSYMNIRSAKVLCEYPSGEIRVAFPDTPKITALIEKFVLGKLRVEPDKYHNITLYDEHEDEVIRGEMISTLKTFNNLGSNELPN